MYGDCGTSRTTAVVQSCGGRRTGRRKQEGECPAEGQGESGAGKDPYRRPEDSEDAWQTAALAFQDCPDEPCGKRGKAMSFHALWYDSLLL